MQDKEIANLIVDRRRNEDLHTLKTMGGPFTSATAVDTYVSSPDIDDTSKLKRLYLEVRYAKDTSLALPRTSDLFRLIKDHKKLPISTYATNMKLYLKNITANAEVTCTIDDFSHAMDIIYLHSELLMLYM